MLYDIPSDTDRESTYECLNCGDLIESDRHPMRCDECGGVLQNRGMSLE